MKSIVQIARESWACSKAKREHLRRHPACACCDCKASFLRLALQAHHIVPVQSAPERAADPANLITLCVGCHLRVGHMGNWHSWNGNLIETIMAIRQAWHTHAVRQLAGDKL